MERRTPQREAIRRAVYDADRPLSPQEILDAAGTTVRGLGLATVYRTLKAGVEEGWLTPVELPGGPTRYEAAGKHHHHHFECVRCHRVFDLEGCPGNLSTLLPTGFTLESHEVLLFGRCGACAAA